jgi:hypothetical protein
VSEPEFLIFPPQLSLPQKKKMKKKKNAQILKSPAQTTTTMERGEEGAFGALDHFAWSLFPIVLHNNIPFNDSMMMFCARSTRLIIFVNPDWVARPFFAPEAGWIGGEFAECRRFFIPPCPAVHSTPSHIFPSQPFSKGNLQQLVCSLFSFTLSFLLPFPLWS